jgi:hypothetical protein
MKKYNSHCRDAEDAEKIRENVMISRPPAPNHVRGSWASLESTEKSEKINFSLSVASESSVRDIFSFGCGDAALRTLFETYSANGTV